MEVPRLGVKLELQLPAYATATAMQDPSWVCDLHQSSQQRQILNLLSRARDPTSILTNASQFIAAEPPQEFPFILIKGRKGGPALGTELTTSVVSSLLENLLLKVHH